MLVSLQLQEPKDITWLIDSDMQKMVNFLREHRVELTAVSIRAAEGLPGSRKQQECFF